MPRLAEMPAQPTYSPPVPAVDPRDLVVRVPGYGVEIGKAADGTYGHWDEAWMSFYDGFATPEAAAEGLQAYCRQLEGPPQAQPELPTREWTEELTELGQEMGQYDVPQPGLAAPMGARTGAGMVIETFHNALGGRPLSDGWDTAEIAASQPVKKASIPVLDDLLAASGLTREKALDILRKYGVKDARGAFSGLRMLGKLPKGMSFEEFEPMYAELVAPPEGKEAVAVTSEPAADCRCDECDAGMTSAQKGVAVKWAGNPKRKLVHQSGRALILCGDCRAKRQ